ncbi:MAG: hypothetical protein AAB491_01670 [Patescibacteria group bacterium]
MNWTSLVLWLLFGLGIYSFLIVPILMELAVDRKQRRTPEDELRIKKNGFVIKYLYRLNFNDWLDNNNYLDVPENICELYRGIWWGFFAVLGSSVFVLVVMLIYIIMTISTSIFGFVPDIHDKLDGAFHSYQRYGKDNEKKFIAPWKILAPISLLVLIILKGKTILMTMISILTSTIAMYIYIAVLGMVSIVWIFNMMRKQEFWSATKEFIKAKKEKVCLKIILVEIEK